MLVDADVPHELLRAMDIPYVVNQWWASICAAKQRAAALPGTAARARLPRLPRAVQRRSRSARLWTAEEAPWGGLPAVSAFVTQVWTDAHRGIAEAWERERGVPFFALEKAVDERC